MSRSSKIQLYAFIIILHICAFSVYGQNTLTPQQLIREMLLNPESINSQKITLKCHVNDTLNPENLIALFPELDTYLQDSFLIIPGAFDLTIEAENLEVLVIKNMSFDYVNLSFRNLKTENSSDPTADVNGDTYYWLKFLDCKFDTLEIVNSDKSIEVNGNEIKFMDLSANDLAYARIVDSEISHFQTSFNQILDFHVINSRSKYFALLEDNLDLFKITGSQFGFDRTYQIPEDSLVLWYAGSKKLEIKNDSSTLLNTFSNNVFFDLASVHAEEIIISENIFYSSKYHPMAHLAGDFQYFSFLGNQVEVPVDLSIRANAGFSMRGNDISGNISFDNTSLPSTPSNKVSINWDEIRGRLVSTQISSSEESLFYAGESQLELSDAKEFTDLIMSYQKIYNVFKSQGDVEQANAAYIEMKDIYLRRLKYIYQTEGGTTNFFKLRLGQLLKIYTEHGTNPGQAMTASVWLILFFAIIYFFYPSEWDQQSKIILIKHFNEFRKRNDKGYFKPFVQMTKGLLLSMLNAITLSINAFVTLGFGVIPTKGAARYICIFQGFLGWFLLSIFIVALINQVMF